jgi:adenosylmethionine-8-amino-7-oxononanoate aminotransferase
MLSPGPEEGLDDRLVVQPRMGEMLFFLFTGGDEAVDTAIELASQIHIYAGRPQQRRFIARWKL